MNYEKWIVEEPKEIKKDIEQSEREAVGLKSERDSQIVLEKIVQMGQCGQSSSVSDHEVFWKCGRLLPRVDNPSYLWWTKNSKSQIMLGQDTNLQSMYWRQSLKKEDGGR